MPTDDGLGPYDGDCLDHLAKMRAAKASTTRSRVRILGLATERCSTTIC